MKKLILIFISIILLSSCFNKNMEETKSGNLNTGNTEINTGEIEREGEMYGDIEIIDFPANQIEKLDKLPYPILSDKEPICKNGEQKVEFKEANITYCISNEYMGCNNMGCLTFNKDDSGNYYKQNEINESSDIIRSDDQKGFSKISGIYSYPKETRKLIIIYKYENYYSKVYNFGDFFIIDTFEKDTNLYYNTRLYIIKNNYYLVHLEFNKENPDIKRFLETLYINK